MKKQQKYDKHRNKSWFVESNKKRSKTYRLKHPFKILSQRGNQYAKHRQRLTSFDLWKIAKKQRLICPLSGRKLTRENISIDHIEPLSKGGKNTIDNVRLVTKDVNFAKNQLPDKEFFSLCQDVCKTQFGF